VTDDQQGDQHNWSPTERLAAANRMRGALKDSAGLSPISEAAAAFFADLFDADVAAITLLRGDEYRKLTAIGEGAPGEVVHDVWEPYPTSVYSELTKALKSGRGFVAAVGCDGGIPQTQTLLQKLRIGTCVGAPIVHRGNVIGEVFVSRHVGRPNFTGRDLALALDLARQLGFRIGPAIIAYEDAHPQWWPEPE
jgi:GAF domain-containing protein